MHWVVDVSLLDGWLPAAVTWTAAAGAAVLLGTQSRRYLALVLPLSVSAAALSAVAAYFLFDNVWGKPAKVVDNTVYLWIGVAILALLAVVPRMVVSSTTKERFAAAISAIVVITAAAGAVNLSLGYLPTVGSAVALAAPDSSIHGVTDSSIDSSASTAHASQMRTRSAAN